MTAEQISSFRQPAKLRIEDFLLLDRAGSLKSYAKTELINGTIIVVNSQYKRHARAKNYMMRALDEAIRSSGQALEAISEVSVSMPPFNLPEPDVLVTDDPSGEGFVQFRSVLLVVEVSDSTVRDDLGEKARLYAEHGVPEYWVVDLPGKILHQLWAPGADGFAERRAWTLGDVIEAVTIAGLSVNTEQVARV